MLRQEMMKGVAMKKKWIILVIYLLAVVGAMVGLFMTLPDEPKEVKIEGANVKVEELKSETRSPETVAGEFFPVIYEYDTSKRLFYEGAEAYMTKEAYEQLLPMPSEEGTDDVFFHMQSRLENFLIYKREISETEVELMAEVHFSVSGSGEYTQRQIVKLRMQLENGQWIITACTVMDTEGE